jgi:hypothetical protein
MVLELPFTNVTDYDFTVQLGTNQYDFNVHFNDRSKVWTFDLSETSTSNVLLQSIPIVLGINLLRAYNLNIGSIVALDTTNQNQDATATDLGTRVKVYWISPDEVSE